jgi:hypothetical protein
MISSGDFPSKSFLSFSISSLLVMVFPKLNSAPLRLCAFVPLLNVVIRFFRHNPSEFNSIPEPFVKIVEKHFKE